MPSICLYLTNFCQNNNNYSSKSGGKQILEQEEELGREKTAKLGHSALGCGHGFGEVAYH